ncbi:glycosyltransferase [Schaalia naturae]|uniref:Glycosyltransferase n=1 Tax=Schaalia naturae TaxID=635203 RepID=A0ABW2SKX9_9ACTO
MTDADESGGTLPRVVVLMATYNGMRWIDEQIDSILVQRGVEVRLCISDDGSDDGTAGHVRTRARNDARITVLPPRRGPRGVTANFIHLFTSWEPTDDVYVAFSDQDDIWHPDKLDRQIHLIDAYRADAVSSDVVSFDSHGRRRVIVKSQPQVKWDHIFEAGGPGSTYMFTPVMHRDLVRALRGLDTTRVGVHDWFLYALTRGLGGRWHIDPQPTVDYRQHGNNVQGENFGFLAFRTRLEHLRSGFYREQFRLTAGAVQQLARSRCDVAYLKDLQALVLSLDSGSPSARLAVLRRFREIRRKRMEGFELGLSCVLGLW